MIRRDGHSKDLDAMLSGLVGSILDASAWLLVACLRVAVCHHDNILVFSVVGAVNHHFSDASLDGTVCVGALADVLDILDGLLQARPLTSVLHVPELSDQLDLVTVVQSSSIPG